MLMNKNLFMKKVFELLKRDDSAYNVVCQVIHDFELDGTEVGEWVRDDDALLDMIKSEFKINKNINELF